MSKKSSSDQSQTDWARILSMRDEDIDLAEIPEITEEQLARATLRIGGKPVPERKVRVNMYLDPVIVAYFKTRAGGRGYQTLINETLRASISQKSLEDILRRVIREELNASD